jgi:hypothetical protein
MVWLSAALPVRCVNCGSDDLALIGVIIAGPAFVVAVVPLWK